MARSSVSPSTPGPASLRAGPSARDATLRHDGRRAVGIFGAPFGEMIESQASAARSISAKAALPGLRRERRAGVESRVGGDLAPRTTARSTAASRNRQASAARPRRPARARPGGSAPSPQKTIVPGRGHRAMIGGRPPAIERRIGEGERAHGSSSPRTRVKKSTRVAAVSARVLAFSPPGAPRSAQHRRLDFRRAPPASATAHRRSPRAGLGPVAAEDMAIAAFAAWQLDDGARHRRLADVERRAVAAQFGRAA